ncbi:hypothetical protein K439DRAFT_140154 [Ramaria rubella]|nr:hypothetical protein K439DRAFT_140154 [Ramaria rubella]
MVLSLYRTYSIVTMLGGIKNAFTGSRSKLTWLLIIEGSRRVTISGVIILATLILLLVSNFNFNSFASAFSLPIEAILVSRLLLDLREAKQTTDGATSSPMFTTVIPMDADGVWTDIHDDSEHTSQASAYSDPSNTMDVSLKFDNEPQRRGWPRRSERDETTIDVSKAYLPPRRVT